jgi:hypothetical protein
MIFDSTNLFSDSQAITASAVSDNVIDLGVTQTPKHAANAITRDIGKGTPIELRVQVTEDFATLTSLVASIQTSDDEAFTSPVTVLSSPAVPAADLAAGYVFPLTMVPRGTMKRYVRMNYTVAGSDATAGAVLAGFTFANDQRDV